MKEEIEPFNLSKTEMQLNKLYLILKKNKKPQQNLQLQVVNSWLTQMDFPTGHMMKNQLKRKLFKKSESKEILANYLRQLKSWVFLRSNTMI